MGLKHTPGPWKAKKNNAYFVADIMSPPAMDRGFGGEVRWTLANVTSARPSAAPGEAEANARLIAAAPDLLEAAQAVIRGLNGAGEIHPIDEEALRAAIQKATGEE